MSTAKSPIRVPLLLASLAALLLLLSSGMLLLSFFAESNAVDGRQSALELAGTVEELTTVVKTDSAEWVQSDQLARLVASADAQVNTLAENNDGVFASISSAAKTASVREVGADWKLLREGLLSFNQASLNQASLNQTKEYQEKLQAAAIPKSATLTTESVNAPVPNSLVIQTNAIAQSFEPILVSVNEGTRLHSLIDLVNTTSNNWAQLNGSSASVFAEIVARQKDHADELLRLSGAGTEKSLFGYYTSNEIVEYVHLVKNIQLSEPLVSTEPSPVNAANVALANISTTSGKDAAPKSSAFVTEALASLKASVAKLLGINAGESNQSSVINWLGLAGLIASLLLLVTAITQMINASELLKLHAEQQKSISRPVKRGAMSLREADELIEEIKLVSDGDLRQRVKLPENGHAKAIAKSANRSSGVISDLVSMTRGVAARLNALVRRQEDHSRVLAELDIRRQTETAELSDGIGARSGFLEGQRVLLSSSAGLIKQITDRSDSAVNGANQVSASLASVSAQVDVGIERMQRLLKISDSVTQATAKLKQLTEQTRLQALNISLKIPQIKQDTAVAGYSEFDSYSDFSGNGFSSDSFSGDSFSGNGYSRDEFSRSSGGDATDMFDDIHKLTGKLVQVSNETDTLISALQRDIEETAQALQQSSAEMNQSAHHTHAASLLGKEVTGYSDQLRDTIEKTLQGLEAQQGELSQSAERLVRLDQTGNEASELTLALSQDLTGLQEMASKLEESVSGFKIRGEGPLE